MRRLLPPARLVRLEVAQLQRTVGAAALTLSLSLTLTLILTLTLTLTCNVQSELPLKTPPPPGANLTARQAPRCGREETVLFGLAPA